MSNKWQKFNKIKRLFDSDFDITKDLLIPYVEGATYIERVENGQALLDSGKTIPVEKIRNPYNVPLEGAEYYFGRAYPPEKSSSVSIPRPEEEGLKWNPEMGLYEKDISGQRAFFSPSREGRWMNLGSPEAFREPGKWKDEWERRGMFDHARSVRALEGDPLIPLKTPVSAGKFVFGKKEPVRRKSD